MRHRTWNSSFFPHARLSMHTETSFCRQPLRKGMQRWVLYTCFCQKQKSEMKTSYRKGLPLFIADSIAVPTFSRYSIAHGWILEASVFHSLHVRSARCKPFVSKYLCRRGAEIPSILSGVNPSSAPLQCPNKETHQIRNEKKKEQRTSGVWLSAQQ